MLCHLATLDDKTGSEIQIRHDQVNKRCILESTPGHCQLPFSMGTYAGHPKMDIWARGYLGTVGCRCMSAAAPTMGYMHA